MSVPLLALFAFAAVLNSVILGTVFVWRGRRTHLLWLGLMFLCIGYLLAVYALEHYDQIWIGGWIRVSYDVGSLLLSCFLLEYVFRGLLRRRPTVAVYGPVVAYLAVLAVLGGRFLEWFTIELLVLTQSFYTVTALVVCLRIKEVPGKVGRRSRVWIHPFAATIVFLTIHAAHLLRVFLGGSADRDIAPAIGIAVLIAMTTYALTSARFSAWVTPRPRLGTRETDELLAGLDGAMTKERLFVRSELDLAALARAVGSTTQNVSAVLNTKLGKTFYEYVTWFRVQEAERLLRDPNLENLSLEAIGTDSGFKSRSSFYSAFKNATGLTPGEYRRSRIG